MTGAAAGWRVAAASVVGTSHIARDQPCQDAHVVRILPDGSLLIAVADGAGSAARSEDGARIATETAADAIEAALLSETPTTAEAWEAVLRGAFAAARKALAAFADSEQIGLRDLAATLSCTVVTEKFVAVAQLGDGLVVTEDPDGQLASVIAPDRGEYANETSFLVEKDAAERIKFWGDARPVRAVAASTDGLLRLAMELPEFAPYQPFFASLFAFVADADDPEVAHDHLLGFLSSDRINDRTDDDKTLVIAHRWPCDRPKSSETQDSPAEPETAADAPAPSDLAESGAAGPE